MTYAPSGLLGVHLDLNPFLFSLLLQNNVVFNYVKDWFPELRDLSPPELLRS